MADPPVPVLELADVWKGFDRGDRRLWVLQDVSLSVGPREFVSVVGTRDQGKTTLVKVAAGIDMVDRGAVRVCGQPLAGLRDRDLSALLRYEIGLATRGGPELRMQVRDYVGLQLVTGRRRSGRECRLKVGEALELLEVTDCAAMRWEQLSNWQRVRVELAQAVAGGPRLLLVDDLLDGLGLGKVQEATGILRMLCHEIGCGILMAASDHSSALPSDRVWQLSRGKLTLLADHASVIPLRRDRRAS